MSLSKFESMLKTNNVYFFDATEFENIIDHYLNIGKHSLAHKALQLGLEQHPTSVALKLLQVELLVFEDKTQQAVKLLAEIEAIEPYNDEVFVQRATILSKNNNHTEAIEVLKTSLEYTEDPVDIWALIGMEYLYLDDYENARLNFAKCIDVDFEDYSSLHNIIYCFEMNEQFEDAIKFLNLYIERNPYSEIAWHQLGKQYYTLNNFKEALKSFEYAVLIDDEFIGGYLEKAKTLEQLKRYQEAIENYMVTLKLDDPTAFVYTRIGECFQQLKDYENAIVYFKKAVYEDPLLDKGWILLTDLYCYKKDYKEALYYIKNALELEDANPLYWRKYASINLNLNSYKEAAKGLYKCIDLEDYDIEVYLALADTLSFLGDFDQALQIVIKAKRMYKNFAEIEYRLCGLFMIFDNQNFALIHLKNALAIDYEYHSVVKELYPVAFNHKKVQEIIANYKKN